MFTARRRQARRWDADHVRRWAPQVLKSNNSIPEKSKQRCGHKRGADKITLERAVASPSPMLVPCATKSMATPRLRRIVCLLVRVWYSSFSICPPFQSHPSLSITTLAESLGGNRLAGRISNSNDPSNAKLPILVNLGCDLRYAFVMCCTIRMLSNALLSESRAVSNFEPFIL